MQSWQEEMLTTIGAPDLTEAEVFARALTAAKALGFDYCAYGVRLPLPFTRPQTASVNNYPTEWQKRYMEANYLAADPTVALGQTSCLPMLWSDELFANAKPLWDEARSVGLRFGWAQSSLDGVRAGLLTLARSHEAITPSQLQASELNMRWLANMVHVALARRLTTQFVEAAPVLTAREIEVLRWSADGKTAPEIGDILEVANSTVVFHVANAMRKLNVSSRTAATVKAAMLGLLG